nr:RNA-directed DNA polymerase, eukaryota [Tanacetum cinerariifolium]
MWAIEETTRDESHEVSSSLSHPPGFTPDVSVIQNENGQSAKEIPVVVNAKVMNNSQDVYKEASYDNVDPNVVKREGSEAVGNSGGIFSVWEATVFKKDYATIFYNFVAIYGIWLPSNSKVLFVAIYAPQQVSRKRLLWDYVSTLIDRWNGEVVVLGDFSEVRNIDERHGSCFNPTSAKVFDQFISALGLVDVKMEGYTFTWSQPSRSKTSKLDKFLVSEGIFSIFPSITAICLDRHLSDHPPIILCKVQVDFGPILFRFYHFWISLEGFDAMVEQTWRSFSHNDANKMIHFKKDSGPQGSVDKIVTKVLANRLALVILDLISDTQSAFVANRQILDGSFILNELLHWCKRKKKQVMFFKVDFTKAYDSIRWDYLLDVLEAFEFVNIWCVFKGVHLHGSTSISHLLYADDVMFIGEWSDDNLKGVMVGECMSRHNAWDSKVDKLRSRISKWKVKTLSIGGRFTFLKAILDASPLYNMSIFKVPKGILNSMEAIRSKFFNGMEPSTYKITWAAWNNVLASKENESLGVSSYHALNRASLLK